MTIEIRDVELLPMQALRMNMHEVPSYYSFHVTNTTLECPLGSISSGQRPTQLSARPPDYIAEHRLTTVPV